MIQLKNVDEVRSLFNGFEELESVDFSKTDMTKLKDISNLFCHNRKIH